ncbi:MAG: phosphoglucosamine mutase [Bacteroidales bacterium]|nr:phosphoglucosamine mutase [Bacteroidales bacterium]
MTLIKSISGIRGTIGGTPSDNLTPVDVVKFASAYAVWMKENLNARQYKVVLGRDARVSGPIIQALVASTLQGCGIDVIDLGLATTPTTEMAVVHHQAQGGIILTASHNPAQWNALKLLDHQGEFLSAAAGARILQLAETEAFSYVTYDKLGRYSEDRGMDERHIQAVLDLEWVNPEAIRKAGFTVAIDAVNSVGGVIIPQLLSALGVKNIVKLYCEPNGLFPHNPEPLPENLTELSALIKEKGADIGFVVDPDVDRLAILNENGSMFGEEYTLVAVADYILEKTGPGNTVSNLSSTGALKDITEKHGGSYEAAAVGEVNVVEKMKQTNAVIGGEGNGGVIYPELHYGRDALVGIALFLSSLAEKNIKSSQLRSKYPEYVISKNKIELTPEVDVDQVLKRVKEKYRDQPVIDIDGVKIHFGTDWVHLRKSNTEPIIRIYSESTSAENAENLARKIMQDILDNS